MNGDLAVSLSLSAGLFHRGLGTGPLSPSGWDPGGQKALAGSLSPRGPDGTALTVTMPPCRRVRYPHAHIHVEGIQTCPHTDIT